MGHKPQELISEVLSVPAVEGVNTGTPLGAPPEYVGVAGQSDPGVAVGGRSNLDSAFMDSVKTTLVSEVSGD